MAKLAKAVREYLASQPTFSTKFPGGIHPDIVPAGVGTGPYGVMVGATSDPRGNLDGSIFGRLESFTLIITAPERTTCDTLAKWVTDLLRVQGSWSGITDPVVRWWRCAPQGDVAEAIIDGADESIRQVTLEIIGFIAATS
jgi:hypothetical protein